MYSFLTDMLSSKFGEQCSPSSLKWKHVSVFHSVKKSKSSKTRETVFLNSSFTSSGADAIFKHFLKEFKTMTVSSFCLKSSKIGLHCNSNTVVFHDEYRRISR